MDKVFCKAPFLSVRSGEHQYLPACVHLTKERHTDLDSYLQSNALADLRERYSNPEADFDPGCRVCMKTESMGQKSYRLDLLEKWQDVDDLSQIIYLDIFPGNICNLRCMMCSPDVSSGLAAEHKQLGWIKNYKITDFSNRALLDIASLEKLRGVAFIGGEFFLTEKNKKILEICLDRNLSVRVVTNGTLLDEELLDILSSFHDLELDISMDGTNEVYELLRYPAKWKDIKDNLDILAERVGVRKMRCLCTVQPLNIQNVISLMDHNNRMKMSTKLHWLVEPEWLSWKILEDSEKQQIVDLLNQQLSIFKLARTQQEEINGLIESLITSKHDLGARKMFIDRFRKISYLRKYDTEDMPRYFGLLEYLSRAITDGY